MYRAVFVLLTFLLLFGCSQPPVAQQLRPDQLDFPPLEFHFPQIVTQELDNGMKLYLKEDHELPLVEMTLMVGGGSILDPLEKTGLSEFFAEVLATGGAGELSAAELEAELEGRAAELSVTSSDYAYEIHLSLHRQDLRRGFEILCDLLRRPRFEAERLELARKQLLESIHRKNDAPGSIARRLLSEAIYPQHPFGSVPAVAAVNSFSRVDLIDLHERYFHPNNVWMAVSGAVEQAELMVLLQQLLADWQPVQLPDMQLPELPSAPPARVFIVDKAVPQTSIMMGHAGISKDNPDLLPLQVANYILGGGGFNSRMMREVRSNRGLAYSVYSYFQIGRHLPGMFIAASETKCGSTSEVVSLMRELMQQMIDEQVSLAELALAKQSMINSFVFAFNDTHAVVSRKLRLGFYAYPERYLETYREKIAAVTVADVQRVAQQYLRPEQLQIVLVGTTADFDKDVEAFGLPLERVPLTIH